MKRKHGNVFALEPFMNFLRIWVILELGFDRFGELGEIVCCNEGVEAANSWL